MVFATRALQVVLKTTGGRLWNKPWGVPKMTRTQKANRRKNRLLVGENRDVLKIAARADAKAQREPAARSGI